MIHPCTVSSSGLLQSSLYTVALLLVSNKINMHIVTYHSSRTPKFHSYKVVLGETQNQYFDLDCTICIVLDAFCLIFVLLMSPKYFYLTFSIFVFPIFKNIYSCSL